MSDMAPIDWKAQAEGARKDSWRRELKVGGGIALLFFVGLLGFAAFVPLDAGVYAEGIVAVSGNRQAVQHPEGGVVTALDVVEGQQVKKGQELLTVSASDTLAMERGLTGRVIALLAERARLMAERTGSARIARPAEFNAMTGDDLAMAQEAMAAQSALLAARRDAMRTQRGVLTQRIRQQDQMANGTRFQMEANREQKELIDEELEGMRSLQDRGFVSLNRIREMERARAALDGNFGAYQADVARSGEAVGEARLQIAGIDRDQMQEVATRLRDVQVELDDLQPKLAATREQLSRSVVRAPAAGKVVGLKVFTIGGVIMPGETLMEVVPQDRNLVIEAKASPQDGDDIRPGMETQIRFSAINERTLPILKGKVTKVSADSLEDARSGMRYYALEVVVPPTEMDKLRAVRADGGLRAGLPAEVLVPLRKRSALTYLTEPLTQTLWRTGREH